MINKKVFREYDIRGVYPDEVNEETAYKVGKSYGTILQKYYNMHTCTVGMDNRFSSPSLKKELIQGLLDTGINDIVDVKETTDSSKTVKLENNVK